MESKPHERIDLLSVNIFQTKKSILIVMKTCLRETDEAIWESPFQLTPPPRPLFLSNIFITHLKNEPPPLILGGGVRKLWNLKKIKVKNNQGPLPPK